MPTLCAKIHTTNTYLSTIMFRHMAHIYQEKTTTKSQNPHILTVTTTTQLVCLKIIIKELNIK